MPESRYFIVRNQDDWMIRFNDEEFGPNQSKGEAMLFAVDAARKLGARGKTADVCTMGENGHFRAEWTLSSPSSLPTH